MSRGPSSPTRESACLIRRTSAFDVPDFLVAGARELLVRGDDLPRARDLVESHFGLR